MSLPGATFADTLYAVGCGGCNHRRRSWALVVEIKQFSPASYQATLFTPDEGRGGARLLRTLSESWLEFFDAEPTPYPIPDDAPREFPRLVLSKKNKTFTCEISPARINFYWRRVGRGGRPMGAKSFFDVSVQWLNRYTSETGARVGRLAALRTLILREENAGNVLAHQFCSEEMVRSALSRPTNFELHAHKRFALRSGLNVNSWIRNKSAHYDEDGTLAPVIAVEQDINTLAEEAATQELSPGEVAGFFSDVPAEMDAVLKLYYPAREERIHEHRSV